MNLGEGVQVVSLVVLAALTIASAMGVVLLQNIVHSAFLLGSVFISIAGMYVLLNADFVAAAQVLIYVGAVNVLILFAIMLVNRRIAYKEIRLGALRGIVTAVVCVALFGLLTYTAVSTPWAITATIARVPSTPVVIGQHFFTDYLLPFELASVLLLVALIGAILLARREFISNAPTSLDSDAAEPFALLEKSREQIATSPRKE